jgi:hypothetical protein
VKLIKPLKRKFKMNKQNCLIGKKNTPLYGKKNVTRVHVNQQRIRSNAKLPESKRQPVITVKSGSSNRYGFAVEITGPSYLVYSPDDPLSCGAKLWLETDSKVIVKRK